MRIRPPRPASLAVVCIEKVISTAADEDCSRYATGFLIRDALECPWVVTNWHVLTGRRPDQPGHLVGDASQSPSAIRIAYPSTTRSAFLKPVQYDLYENGEPIWYEYERSKGMDIAAFPVTLPPGAAGIAIDDFAQATTRAMEPGLDLVIVGFPFRQGPEVSYPIWKRAMLSSEPGYTLFGIPQMFVDMPGTPGMSGSPVFRSSPAFAARRQTVDGVKVAEEGEASALDVIRTLSPEELGDETVGLELVGIYAGATADKTLEGLRLGRMFPVSAVRLILAGKGSRGHNPYPPAE